MMVDSFAGPVRRPRTLVTACLLLLLAEQPDHGYSLIERLGDLGVQPAARASVYRYLRMLEAAGLVSSEVETRQSGASRTVYRPTPAGYEALDRCATSIGELPGVLQQLLVGQRSTVGRARPTMSK